MAHLCTVLASVLLLYYHEAQKVYAIFPGVTEQPHPHLGARWPGPKGPKYQTMGRLGLRELRVSMHQELWLWFCVDALYLGTWTIRAKQQGRLHGGSQSSMPPTKNCGSLEGAVMSFHASDSVRIGAPKRHKHEDP